MKQIVFLVGTQLVENLTTIREKEGLSRAAARPAQVEYVGEKKIELSNEKFNRRRHDIQHNT
jgi:hypothetical protein